MGIKINYGNINGLRTENGIKSFFSLIKIFTVLKLPFSHWINVYILFPSVNEDTHYNKNLNIYMIIKLWTLVGGPIDHRPCTASLHNSKLCVIINFSDDKFRSPYKENDKWCEEIREPASKGRKKVMNEMGVFLLFLLCNVEKLLAPFSFIDFNLSPIKSLKSTCALRGWINNEKIINIKSCLIKNTSRQ